MTSESLDPNLPTCGFIIRDPQTVISAQPLPTQIKVHRKKQEVRRNVYLRVFFVFLSVLALSLFVFLAH